jgi:hypothetical protein
MRKPVIMVAASLLMAAAAACGPKPGPTATSNTSAPPSTTQPAEAGAIVIEPGKVGPFVVGTPAKQLLASGLVEEPPKDDCPTLLPVGKFKEMGLAFNHDRPEQPLMGVLIKASGPRTAEGIQIGDTTAHLQATYGSKLAKKTGMYGETTYVLTERKQAIGFTVSDDKITAIDVFAAGDEPGWDGC